MRIRRGKHDAWAPEAPSWLNSARLAVTDWFVGFKRASRLCKSKRFGASSQFFDVVVVGLGPHGIRLVSRLKHLRGDLNILGVDAGLPLENIKKLPRWFQFASSGVAALGIEGEWENSENISLDDFIAYFEGLLEDSGVNYRPDTALVGLSGSDGRFIATFNSAGKITRVRCGKVVLATGVYGQPRRLGIPGENSSAVNRYLPREPDDDEQTRGQVDLSLGSGNGVPSHYPATSGESVVVVGAGGSAALAVLNLYKENRVCWITRRTNVLDAINVRWQCEIETALAHPNVTLRDQSKIISLSNNIAMFSREGAVFKEDFDRCYLLVGYEPNNDFFRNVIGLDYQDRPEGFCQNPNYPPYHLCTLETNRPGVLMFGANLAQSIYKEEKEDRPALRNVFIKSGRYLADQVADLLQGASGAQVEGSEVSYRISNTG